MMDRPDIDERALRRAIAVMKEDQDIHAEAWADVLDGDADARSKAFRMYAALKSSHLMTAITLSKEIGVLVDVELEKRVLHGPMTVAAVLARQERMERLEA